MMYPENMQPSDVIESSWLEEYEKQRDVIWWQLVEFNNDLFLIERIEEFPFHIFTIGPTLFWVLTKNALIGTCIMIIWRVILDTDSRSLTLRHFKNQIMQHLRDEKMKQRLGKYLKSSDFEDKIAELELKVIEIRHNYLAHLNRDMNTNPDPQRILEHSLDITEMKHILAVSYEIFNALCFNHGLHLWYWDYSDSAREKRETDIDRLLNSVARESAILNLPERDPVWWEITKPDYPENWITTINEYRRKFGMDEA